MNINFFLKGATILFVFMLFFAGKILAQITPAAKPATSATIKPVMQVKGISVVKPAAMPATVITTVNAVPETSTLQSTVKPAPKTVSASPVAPAVESTVNPFSAGGTDKKAVEPKSVSPVRVNAPYEQVGTTMHVSVPATSVNAAAKVKAANSSEKPNKE